MTRVLTILLAVAAGMTEVAAGYGVAAARAADAGPCHVRVVDARDQAVPKIDVEVRVPDQPIRSFTTGDDGRVTIPAGVAVEGAVLSAARGKEALAWARVGDATPGRPGDSPRRPVVMKLVPLTHRVDGSLVDRQGKPIAGARIGVGKLIHRMNPGMDQDVNGKDPLLGLAVTDEAGRFSMALPQDTGAYLFASHPRHVGLPIAVRADAKTVGPITLQPAGWIAGRVTDAATGKPVAGAAVAAQFVERRRRMLTDGWGRAVTDDRGGFVIGGLEPGVFNLVLIEVPGRNHATAAAVEGVRVKTGEESTADLAVIEGRPLRGVVIDRGNGDRPIAGAQVGCQGPAQPRLGQALMVTETNGQGRFAFHVPPGEQSVYLIDDPTSGRMGRRVVVVPEQGDVLPVFLLLSSGGNSAATASDSGPVAVSAPLLAPAIGAAARPDEKLRTVTGRVSDPKGRPLAGVRVAVGTGPAVGRPDLLNAAITDREGTFVLEGVQRVRAPISLSRPAYQLQSDNIPADKDEVALTYRLHPDEAARRPFAPVEDEPVPQDLRGRLTFVDLTSSGTAFLADGPGEPNDGNNLDRVPRGIHKLGDAYFRIGDRMVQDRGTNKQNVLNVVAGIKLGARGKRLHILHGNQQQTEPGTGLGNYVIHYADGSQEKIPIAYGKNVVDWWHFPTQTNDPSDAKIAWKGSNQMVEDKKEGVEIRLYSFTWTNPHPDKEITRMDVASSMSACDPFLIAVTVEREK
jgi:hypothetical protein